MGSHSYNQDQPEPIRLPGARLTAMLVGIVAAAVSVAHWLHL